jgi:hypothetical protein
MIARTISGPRSPSRSGIERGHVMSLGDRPALALLVGRYGLMRFNVAGSGGGYARDGEEAALLARECRDPLSVPGEACSEARTKTARSGPRVLRSPLSGQGCCRS